MSVLGREKILNLLSRRNINKRLVVTPLLSQAQIGQASIDIRLGNDFKKIQRMNLSHLDPVESNMDRSGYHIKQQVNFGEKFHLHPHELVLASTLEYFRLPQNIAGYVTSRSSWGRAGLVIATATAVHPGFTGSITLELVNLGEVPLVLYPGLPVAQIVLQEAKGAKLYDGRFAHHTSAELPRLHQMGKDEIDFWSSAKNFR